MEHSKLKIPDDNRWWIGGIEVDGSWRWTTGKHDLKSIREIFHMKYHNLHPGENMDFTYWDSGQPNSHAPTCLYFQTSGHYFTWNDNFSSEQKFFICEA